EVGLHERVETAARELPVDRVDACRLDPDQHLTGCHLRIGVVGDGQLVGSAVLIQNDRLHVSRNTRCRLAHSAPPSAPHPCVVAYTTPKLCTRVQNSGLRWTTWGRACGRPRGCRRASRCAARRSNSPPRRARRRPSPSTPSPNARAPRAARSSTTSPARKPRSSGRSTTWGHTSP